MARSAGNQWFTQYQRADGDAPAAPFQRDTAQRAMTNLLAPGPAPDVAARANALVQSWQLLPETVDRNLPRIGGQDTAR